MPYYSPIDFCVCMCICLCETLHCRKMAGHSEIEYLLQEVSASYSNGSNSCDNGAGSNKADTN